MEDLSAHISIHLLKEFDGAHINAKLAGKSNKKLGAVYSIVGFLKINKTSNATLSVNGCAFKEELQDQCLVLAAVVLPEATLRCRCVRVCVAVQSRFYTLCKPPSNRVYQ